MFPFESIAYANTPSQDPFGGMGGLIPMILIVVVFWFFLIRPQQKRQKQHQQMISDLGKGDKIVTTGGLFGTITKIGDDRMTVEISDKVRVQIERSQVSRLDIASSEKPKSDSSDKDKDDSADEKGSKN